MTTASDIQAQDPQDGLPSAPSLPRALHFTTAEWEYLESVCPSGVLVSSMIQGVMARMASGDLRLDMGNPRAVPAEGEANRPVSVRVPVGTWATLQGMSALAVSSMIRETLLRLDPSDLWASRSTG